MSSYEAQKERLDNMADEIIEKIKTAPDIINKDSKLYVKCGISANITHHLNTGEYDRRKTGIESLKRRIETGVRSHPMDASNLALEIKELRNYTNAMLESYKAIALNTRGGAIEVDDVIYRPVYGPGRRVDPVVTYLMNKVNDLEAEVEKLKIK